MGQAPEILLVDDDSVFTSNLASYFALEGLSVFAVNDPSASAAIDFTQFRLLLLDLDMPAMSGKDVLRLLPDENRPLVIVISGHSDIETRMEVLAAGADFFVSKPANLQEVHLIALRALGRSTHAVTANQSWVLARTSLTLTAPSGASSGLSSSEFRILERLLENPAEPVSKEELIAAATGRPANKELTYTRTLEALISRMRRQYSTSKDNLIIKSVRNMGYVFHGNGMIVD